MNKKQLRFFIRRAARRLGEFIIHKAPARLVYRELSHLFSLASQYDRSKPTDVAKNRESE